MYMKSLKKIILFINLFIICFATLSKNSFTEEIVGADGETYDVVLTKKLKINTYAHVGYSFSYVPFAKKEGVIDYYKNMLRKDQHGYNIGVGVIVNKNWTFGVSFQHNIIISKDIDPIYANLLESVRTETFMMNLDVGMRMPFTFFRERLNFYVVSGLNVVIASLQNNYLPGIKEVPVELAGVLAQPAFGGNLGIATKFHFLRFFYVGAEAKRLFIFTSNSSLIKDTWIVNAFAGIVF